MTTPVRVPSSLRLPPEPDRLAGTKRTRTDRLFLLFACLCLAIVVFFLLQCAVLYLWKRALERENQPVPEDQGTPAFLEERPEDFFPPPVASAAAVSSPTAPSVLIPRSSRGNSRRPA